MAAASSWKAGWVRGRSFAFGCRCTNRARDCWRRVNDYDRIFPCRTRLARKCARPLLAIKKRAAKQDDQTEKQLHRFIAQSELRTHRHMPGGQIGHDCAAFHAEMN